RHVVVRSRFERTLYPLRGRMRAQKDDRKLAQPTISANAFAQLQSAHAGQGPFEHDQVDACDPKNVERRFCAICAQYFVTCTLEQSANHRLHISVTIDEQDMCTLDRHSL